jgi:hypothetical protein
VVINGVDADTSSSTAWTPSLFPMVGTPPLRFSDGGDTVVTSDGVDAVVTFYLETEAILAPSSNAF